MRQAQSWKSNACFLSLVAYASVVSGAHRPSDKTLAERSAPPASLPRVVGFNLAGLDFGMQTDGSYTSGPVVPPISQITHFTKQGVGIVRIPVAWPYLQPKLDQPFTQASVDTLKKIVSETLSAGAYALVECHSFARFNSQIVGQSSVTAESMASFWVQLVKLFPEEKVLVSIANEPHDLDLTKWKDTVQTVVAAIDKVDPKKMILIPGDDYTSLKAFSKWYPVMKTVTRPGGSTEGLILEVHSYLDSDTSGKSTECTSSHVEQLQAAVQLAKADNRMILIGETGGGSSQSCQQILPQFFEAVKDAYPTVWGAIMWAGGAFDASYELVMTVADKSAPDGWKDRENWMSIAKYVPTSSESTPKRSTKSSKNLKSGTVSSLKKCKRRLLRP